jgi:hypothetical protein
LWLGAALGLILVQALVAPPQRSIFWTATLDAGHVPLYGMFALIMLRVSWSWSRRTHNHRLGSYLTAGGLTVAAGGLTEVLQAFGSRDAEVADFARNAAGAATALLVALAFDRKVTVSPSAIRIPRPVMLLLAVALLTIAVFPVTTIAIAYLQRDRAFPRICDFEAAWERKFVAAKDAELTITSPPREWGRAAQDKAGRVTFLTGEYPALVIQEPHPDWGGHDRFVFEVYSELQEPVAIVLRINDIHHRGAYSDRFNRELVIDPGANRISIPLPEVETSPRRRRMDLTHIRNVTIFADHPVHSFSLYVDALHLE